MLSQLEEIYITDVSHILLKKFISFFAFFFHLIKSQICIFYYIYIVNYRCIVDT